MAFDRIRHAIEESEGSLLVTMDLISEVAELGRAESAAEERDLYLAYRGRRFWLQHHQGSDSARNGEYVIFLPLPEYPAEVGVGLVLRLLAACRSTRLAVAREAGVRAAGRSFVIGAEYVMPIDAVAAATLRWVLDQLIADADRLEAVLAEDAAGH
jgi:hypothetical protein